MNAVHVALALVLPILLACVVRKTKALMQGRRGATFLQPAFDLAKRFRKAETVSTSASWVFRANPLVTFAASLLLALILPWTGASPPGQGSGAADLVLAVYLFAGIRFFSVLAALDTGSAFGGIGASREAALGVQIEPGVLIGLGAVALCGKTMDLSVALGSRVPLVVGLLSGVAFLLAGLAELSRMPVDDPTTHLELTMVHEATILENSGRNLALVELAVMLRTAVVFGLGTRMILAGLRPHASQVVLTLANAAIVLLLGLLLAVLEGVAVKLNWRRIPSFVAFSTALAVMSAFMAAVSS